jgi:aminomethyltransferase
MVRRVGLTGLERMPVREGATLFDGQGRKAGHVTSGTLAPTLGVPIAMAYVGVEHAAIGHELFAEVRGKRLPMRVTPMPFQPHRYHRG